MSFQPESLKCLPRWTFSLLRCAANLAFALPLINATALAHETSDESDEVAEQAIQLLIVKCASCHCAELAEGGLRLDVHDGIERGGDRGASIVVGKPDLSLLYQSIAGKHDDLQMPPKNPLSDREVAIIERWIKTGAKWKEPLSTAMVPAGLKDAEEIGDAWTDPRNPITKIFGGQRLDLWSLRVPVKPDQPQVQDSSRCKNAIDYFAQARFESAGIAPPLQADRLTLLRRIYFDLTGLPPSYETAKSFAAEQNEQAIEEMIDRLLESDQFGVHWARMWLDVARYSDSNGFDWDEFRPQAWQYRDYVIRSLNQDKPYDQFIREQLAGDEMFDGAPMDDSQRDALIATGFLRMGPHDNAAKLFNEQDRSRDELMTDLVETTSGTLLGLTFSCCRCHDHKFDPLLQADHFRLRACFAGVQFADDLPIDLAARQAEVDSHNAEIESQIAKLEESRDAILESIKQRVLKEHAEASKKPSEKSLRPDQLTKVANDGEKSQLDKLESEIDQKQAEKWSHTHALLMVDAKETPPATFVLYQGDYKSPRGEVTPGVISALNPNPLKAAITPRANSSGRRTALADWIVSPSNPLTSRVIVNRVWQNLMGQGIVRTPGDFGLAGTQPDDPELLDWLACRLMEEQWSIKRLIRTIMLSATYQQAATFEQPAESISHVSRRPRRLTAEQLRDSMLAVSGLLTSKNSGPPQWPDLPQDVLEANPAFLDDNETKTKGWYPSPKAEQYCRSIFLVQKRNTRVPILETLDQPENSVPCQRRPSSIVAPQALSLLNSPEAVEAARNFAKLLEGDGLSDSQRTDSLQSQPLPTPLGPTQSSRVEAAFHRALQRDPTASELAACQDLLERATWTELCRVLLNVNEFAYID